VKVACVMFDGIPIKPAVPSAVAYRYMRHWQRLGCEATETMYPGARQGQPVRGGPSCEHQRGKELGLSVWLTDV